MFTMAQAAAFHLLFALMSLSFCSRHSGITWSSNVPPLSLWRLILVIMGCSIILYACNTHNTHTLIATGTCPCKHVQFKPLPSASVPMPIRLPRLVLDCGRGRRAAKRSGAPAVTQWLRRSHDEGGESRTSFSSFAYHNHKGKIIFVVGIGQDFTGCIAQEWKNEMQGGGGGMQN
jgi:hypothetical protein